MRNAGMLKKTKSVWPCNRRHSWTLQKKVSSRVQRATRMLLISSIYLWFAEKERVSERTLMVNICLYKSPDFTRQTLKFSVRTTACGENQTRRSILSAHLMKRRSQRPLKKHAYRPNRNHSKHSTCLCNCTGKSCFYQLQIAQHRLHRKKINVIFFLFQFKSLSVQI